VFAQQSLQPKLSRRCYASVLYALQNNTVFRRAQNYVHVIDRYSELGEITQNKSHYAVQGHSRSPISLPIEGPYATSYTTGRLTYFNITVLGL